MTDVKLAAREGFRIARASQALHHARHGDRPGQDRQRQRRARCWPRSPDAISARSAPRPSARPTRPVAIGAFAGHHRGKDFRPARLTPSHAWAEEQGAVFVETGPWLRALYYPKRGEDDWQRRGQPRGGECPRAASASATSRPSARSTCRARTPAPSSTASMPTPSRRCPSARRATG